MENLVTFGEKIRSLRELSGMTQREVSAKIEIDASLLAKLENNRRTPTKLQIKNLSKLFFVNEKHLIEAYLSDKIAYSIISEEVDLDVLRVAEKKVSYLKNNRNAQGDEKK